MTHDAYNRLADLLSELGITKSNMFGMPVLKLGRKPIAGLASDGVNFKLPVDSKEHQKALALDGAHLFQPEMKGKRGPVMKQWVVVPFSHESSYEMLAQASIEFVASE
jgi:hypothetical protein